MIVTIPNDKKLPKYKTLNESIFDEEDFDNDITDDIITNNITTSKYYMFIDKIKEVLKYLDVTNYEVIKGSDKLLVNVHNHLHLPNKNLSKIYNPNLFTFNIVDGDCNYSNNNLTNWNLFPYVIKGNCIANFNKIKDFKGCPRVYGRMMAERQKTKTKYPLTQENYELHLNGELKESNVFVISEKENGMLLDINENMNSAIVKLDNGKVGTYKLNDINCLLSLDKLLKL